MCLALFSYSNSVYGLMINEHIHMFRTKLNRKRLSFQVYFLSHIASDTNETYCFYLFKPMVLFENEVNLFTRYLISM